MKFFLSIFLSEYTRKKEQKNRGPSFTTHSKHTFQLNSVELEKDKGSYIFILVEPLIIRKVFVFLLTSYQKIAHI